jgi:hypothetical protein
MLVPDNDTVSHGKVLTHAQEARLQQELDQFNAKCDREGQKLKLAYLLSYSGSLNATQNLATDLAESITHGGNPLSSVAAGNESGLIKTHVITRLALACPHLKGRIT